MDIELGFGYESPTPDAHFQGELDRIAPPNETLTSLLLYWEHGDAWQPINRWFVGHVYPRHAVAQWRRQLLEGPNPRSQGFWQYDEHGVQTWRSLAPPGVNRRQWEFWQAGGGFLEPFWVIQGSKGGHPYQYSQAEQQLMEAQGLTAHLVRPGDLPYADPDLRVIPKIQELDRIRLYGFVLDRAENVRYQLDHEELMAARQLRQEVSDYVDRMAAEVGEELASQAMKEVWDGDIPETDRRLEEKLERVNEQFLEEAI